MSFIFACHDCHFSSPLPRFVCVFGFSLSFSVGELNFDLFLTSSNNLTATVVSNAATEKKEVLWPFRFPWYRTQVTKATEKKKSLHLHRRISVISEQRWRDLLRALNQGAGTNVLQREATTIAGCYWQHIEKFLSTRRPLEEIDSTECSVWIQTGLAFTPLQVVLFNTCDWTIAWSLIGEWTSQEIFLPPAGDWPRNGHSRNLVEEFDYFFFYCVAERAVKPCPLIFQ